jgi:hydrogenase/urease accessory protein HupE
VDDDRDGQLSAAELRRHQADINHQFQLRFLLTTANEAGRVLTSWVLSPQTGGGLLLPTPYVVVLEVIQFTRPIGELRLHTDLFGTRSGETQMSLRATRDQRTGAETELAILDPSAETHVFFRGLWSTFTQSVELGIEHILTGADHLLFLLTILLAAAGWRYWLGVVTSFTVAHSLTLSLSVFGILHAPARLVEPAIAASIVLMALHSLVRRSAQSRWRVALVFACGLLHGLGLASALNAMGLDRAHQLGTLAGFNVGVELGQFMFLAAIFALAAFSRRIFGGGLFGSRISHSEIFGTRLLGTNDAARWPRLSSAAAALLGTIMLVQRLT